VLHPENIVSALKMYYIRLEILKEQASDIESIEELEALDKLDIIQEEIAEIVDHVFVLEELLHRLQHENL